MTIIAWDGRRVAADSLATRSGLKSTTVEKLKLHEGRVFGLTGAASLFEPMIAWFLAGAEPGSVPKARDANDDATLFVFNADGTAWFYRTELPYGEEAHAPSAWGVGAECAMVAMDCGVDLKTAVEKTIDRHVWLGGPIQVIDLHEIQNKAQAA